MNNNLSDLMQHTRIGLEMGAILAIYMPFDKNEFRWWM